ncbi:MAG: hypothetical protein DHS20C09_04330 [marine bacterium B5-7]|nr:MAG: hypothetical protein DHS20C09_04330 [marine bacterium B5-7]
MRFLFILVILIFFNACSDTDNPEVLFDQGQYKESFSLWQPLAKEGDLKAQNFIAIQYYLGLGIQRNHKLARQWFEKAAINGSPDAQYNLGVMYENGEGALQDYSAAYMWFHIANQNGNTNASKRMQRLAEEHKLFPNQMKHAVEQAKVLYH